MTEILGWQARMTVGGNAVEFISSDLSREDEIIPDEGIRGTRSRAYERIALGQEKVGGSITFEPTPAELAFLLPLCVGSSTSATVLTDLLQTFTVVIDTVTDLETYTVACTAVHFTGKPGQKIQMKMDLVGTTCVMGSGGSLNGVPDITNSPYVLSELGSGITLGVTTYSIDDFALSIDNKITPTFMQGRTATDLAPQDRVVMLSLQTRYSATETGLLTGSGGQTGPVIGSPLGASLAFTNGGSNSMSFTFGALQSVPKTVVIPNKGHLRLPLKYQAYKVSTTLETVPALV